MSMSFFGDKNREDELFYALAQELEVPAPESPAAASEAGAAVDSALASVIATLGKFADNLEAVGHPSVAKVDKVLNFIEKEFLTAPTSV